jgi:Na+-translocating ferredoxin:NAD+ oxidoreductase RnfG subunit
MQHVRFIVLLQFCALAATAASAQVLLTRDEALKQVFPSAKSIERKTVFLTDEQVKQIEIKGKAKVDSKVLTYYVGISDSGTLGYAFFETHTVRTMPATYLVVIAPDGSLRHVEILAFYEPEDYLPSKKWLNQFSRKTLDNDLWLKRGIRNISGATLSAQAIVDGTRRILATYQIAVTKEN